MIGSLRNVFVAAMVSSLFIAAGCKNGDEKKMDDKDKMAASLYSRLGGEPAIKAVVDDFVGRAASDPKVNFTRKGIAGAEWNPSAENVAHLKAKLVEFIDMASGGPQKYTGKDMKTAHKGMKITSDEFDALAADLKASLDKFKVPAKEQSELLGAVAGTKDQIVGQ